MAKQIAYDYLFRESWLERRNFFCGKKREKTGILFDNGDYSIANTPPHLILSWKVSHPDK